MRSRTCGRWAGLFLVWVGWAAIVCCVAANESRPVTLTPTTALEQRLAVLESRLAAMESSVGGGGQELDYDPLLSEESGPCAGITGGGEVTFLKAYQSGGLAAGFPCEAAPRVWLGVTTDRGWGVRARWFDYHATAAPPAIWLTDVDLSTLDLEITGAFQLGCQWSGLLSGGVRYAEYREAGAGGLRDDSASLGPVLGLEVQRQLTDRLSLFALGRESLLFGRARSPAPAYQDIVSAVTELQLGTQWQQPWYGSTFWFVRGALEGQFWANASGILGHAALGLAGGTLAIGLDR